MWETMQSDGSSKATRCLPAPHIEYPSPDTTQVEELCCCMCPDAAHPCRHAVGLVDATGHYSAARLASDVILTSLDRRKPQARLTKSTPPPPPPPDTRLVIDKHVAVSSNIVSPRARAPLPPLRITNPQRKPG